MERIRFLLVFSVVSLYGVHSIERRETDLENAENIKMRQSSVIQEAHNVMMERNIGPHELVNLPTADALELVGEEALSIFTALEHARTSRARTLRAALPNRKIPPDVHVSQNQLLHNSTRPNPAVLMNAQEVLSSHKIDPLTLQQMPAAEAVELIGQEAYDHFMGTFAPLHEVLGDRVAPNGITKSANTRLPRIEDQDHFLGHLNGLPQSRSRGPPVPPKKLKEAAEKLRAHKMTPPQLVALPEAEAVEIVGEDMLQFFKAMEGNRRAHDRIPIQTKRQPLLRGERDVPTGDRAKAH